MKKKTFRDLDVGDYAVGPDGSLVRLSRVYDIHVPETMFALTTDNGDVIKVSGNHLFYTESDYDKALHRQRVKNARKVLATMPDYATSLLEEMANSEELEIETTVHDFMDVLGFSQGTPEAEICYRVAESLGPVAIDTLNYFDMMDDKDIKTVVDTQKIYAYDGALMAQQVLALTGKKKYKGYPVIVGKVVTAEEMFEDESYKDMVLPDPPRVPVLTNIDVE